MQSAEREGVSNLHGECVAGVGAAIDDVERGNGQNQLLVARQVSQVLVQGNALLRRARLRAAPAKTRLSSMKACQVLV